ncbi:MAG: ABC transporter ATP-binding protein [Burkholderiaceae bacterium]|jgi:branched-chain amino acid transport system ATP-binding protein|nr:ABC transporter ATP-binding protein [Burkholderiaceae bacterium]MEB2350420.1 ABC transporter ATP-binding protein [Burkholderiaceae bacterium]
MLDLEGVCVSYGRHVALRDVSLRVGAGELVVMLGANGAGKSTLLKTISRLIEPERGARIRFDGIDLMTRLAHRVVEAGIALVPEGRGVFGELSVRENLWLGAWARRARRGEGARLAQVLALFPRLAERLSQTVATMSGGEQQMVAIARALMSAPRLLLLDEPSLGLSPIMTGELFRSLGSIREFGVSVLLVEQNAVRSLAIADRGYLLANGCVVGSGSAATLAEDAAVQRAYLGAAASVEGSR